MEKKIILVDTREHEKERLRVMLQLENEGFTPMLQKLDIGDYKFAGNNRVAVDRKKDLGELLTNMCSKDSGRFWREIRRAKDEGVKLYILCEHGGQYKELADVKNFKSKYSRVTGRELMERMYRAHIAYGVEFLFCNKRSTGRRIIEILEDGCNDGSMQSGA